MSNPLFNALGGGQNGLMQILAQIKNNPMQILAQRFNLPSNMSDPNAIIQHLVSTGQVSQAQIDSAYRQAQQLGFRR